MFSLSGIFAAGNGLDYSNGDFTVAKSDVVWRGNLSLTTPALLTPNYELAIINAVGFIISIPAEQKFILNLQPPPGDNSWNFIVNNQRSLEISVSGLPSNYTGGIILRYAAFPTVTVNGGVWTGPPDPLNRSGKMPISFYPGSGSNIVGDGARVSLIAPWTIESTNYLD